MSESMTVQEFLYDAAGQITKTTDFGIDLQASTHTPSPPHGVRFDFEWRAELIGPKLKGKVVGTNYAFTRPDGVTLVDSHAVLTTPEGDRIAVRTEGISTSQEGASVFQQRENISFYAASKRYAWLNLIQAWGTGTVDISTGRFDIKGYSA